MTTTEKIDAALNAVLKASGYREPACAHIYNLDRMREAMRKIMMDSYIQGSNDARKAASDEIKEILSGEPHH